MNTGLNEKIKNIPTKPGVYQFKNNIGEIIYIGKAKTFAPEYDPISKKTNIRHQKINP